MARSSGTNLFWGIPVLFLVGVAFILGTNAPTPNAGFKDATATLTFVTAVSVGIERCLEIFWTLVGGWLGSDWPLGPTGKKISDSLSQLDTALKPIVAAANAEIADISGKGGAISDVLKGVGNTSKNIAALMVLSPANSQFQNLLTTIAQNVAAWSSPTGVSQENIQTAQTALVDIQNFVSTFNDNPGRRLISLYLGVLIGMFIAWGFGLDLFQAALGVATSKNGAAEVVLTGVVVGLGSNPTHEVIRAIQEYKNNQKTS